MIDAVHPDSVLFVTLDSCRADTAEHTSTPGLDRIGPRHGAMSPGHFTLASHAAFWVGTTPGIAGLGQPVLDPKAGRLFRLRAPGIPATDRDVFVLEGASIVEGFGRAGYRTVGAAAVDWFDPATPAGARLSVDFQEFRFFRGARVEEQVEWVVGHVPPDRPVFAFLNVGETHVPYWHRDAPWDRDDNPCVPFGGARNDRDACVARQSACLTFVDRALAPLVRAFLGATVLVTADHGDAWGEDGLWEHGVWHPSVMAVPMWVRVRGTPCTRW